MTIETVELTLSHVGLGDLTEAALMRIVASIQARRIMEGTGFNAREIVDSEGVPLYPAYYFTHLVVPRSRPLDRFKLWDRVSVGVDVKRYGNMVLDSVAVVGRSGEFDDGAAGWADSGCPTLRGGNLMIVESIAGEEPRVASPARGRLARLPALGAPPPAVEAFRAARGGRAAWPHLVGNVRAPDAVEIEVLPDRDAAPGHAMVFASYVELMDAAEREVLERYAVQRFSSALVDCRSTRERGTFFFASARAGDVVAVEISARVRRPEPGPALAERGVVAAAALDATFTLRRRATGELLVTSRVRKVFAIPEGSSTLLAEAARAREAHVAGES